MTSDKNEPDLRNLSLTETSSSSNDQQEVPVLPIEVLRQVLDQLGNVVDFANVALACPEWRELINSCDACWEKAFMRDYNQYNAEDYEKLPTWRQKYIACTLDETCLKLRDARHQYGETADSIDSFEIAIENYKKSIENAVSEGRLDVVPHQKQGISAFQGSIERLHVSLIKRHEAVEALRAKKESLQAATNYKPKINA